MKLPADFSAYLDSLKAKPNKKFNLDKYATDCKQKLITNLQGEKILKENIDLLADLQEKLYAANRYSVLIVLQAMDAAGKDSVIKHVMTGVNPQGINVVSFKAPSQEELDHDYLWRHEKALPSRGDITIFNRSHYENVLITKVHPEYILKENIPGITSLKKINADFWNERYKQINRFEKNIVYNGTVVLKFFLHVSPGEQRKRFIARIDDPHKNWKFGSADVSERRHWNEYMDAYQSMIAETSQPIAPWFILPGDDKWFTRVCMSSIITRELAKLNLEYPVLGEEQLKVLQQAKKDLLAE